MTRVNRMPACSHVEIGGHLQETRACLIHLSTELSRIYPQASRQVRAANKALRAIDELRNVLERVGRRTAG